MSSCPGEAPCACSAPTRSVTGRTPPSSSMSRAARNARRSWSGSPIGAADPTVVLPDPERWPRIPGFEIQSELGRGGMGVVYLAIETGLDRLVALKVLPGPWAGREHRPSPPLAARGACRLEHPAPQRRAAL